MAINVVLLLRKRETGRHFGTHTERGVVTN